MKAVIILILILFLSTILHFYRLNLNPPGMGIDEVAIGYDAYSILKTARDQYGKFLPLNFRSYDDYKPPLYIYLTVPSVAVFGLTEAGVRLPAILLGISAVAMVYFLVRELIPGPRGRRIGLAGAFLLSISPWHLQFTRAAFEVGCLAFFTSLGTILLIRGLKQNQVWLLLLSAGVFGLEPYLYQAAKVFIPLYVISLIIIFSRNWLKNKILIVGFMTVFLLCLVPTIISSFSFEGQARLRGTSILNDASVHEKNIKYEISDWLRNDRFSAAFFHSEPEAYFREMLFGYFTHFRPDFLFLGKEGTPVHFVPEVGLFHLWEMPFILLGFFYLFSFKDKRPGFLLLSWIILAPLPASVTWGLPSSIRTAIVLPSVQIVEAVGLICLFINLSSRAKILLLPAFLIIFLYFSAFYLHMAFVDSPIVNAAYWYTDYPKIVAQAHKEAPNYRQIIVSTELDQPQGFFLYYLKYDPKIYQQIDGGTVSGEFNEYRNHLANFLFKPLDYSRMVQEKNILMIGSPREIPLGADVIGRFYYLNGNLAALMARSSR